MQTPAPPDQLYVRGQRDPFGSLVWASELPTSAAWAAEYFRNGCWREIPAAWRDKRNWRGIRFKVQDG